MPLSEKTVLMISDMYNIPCYKFNGYEKKFGANNIQRLTGSPILYLDRESEEPTKNELRQLESFQKFLAEGFGTEYDQSNFPIIRNFNTMYFLKAPLRYESKEIGWSYIRMTWHAGNSHPDYRTILVPWGLLQLLDSIMSGYPPKWLQWKNNHKEFFGET